MTTSIDRVESETLRKCMVRAKMEVVRTLLKSLVRELHIEKPGELELKGVFDRARAELQGATKLLPLWSRETEKTS